MITRLKVKNYRSIEGIDLPLSPITVLVGKNASGKSTILDVLCFVRDALNKYPAAAMRQRGESDALFRWTPDNNPSDIEIFVEFADRAVSGDYSFALSKNEANGFSVRYEQCVIHSPVESSLSVEVRNGIRYWNNNGTKTTSNIGDKPNRTLFLPVIEDFITSITNPLPIRHCLTNTEFYDIRPDALREPQIYGDESRLLGDGSNFATILNMILSDAGQKAKFCAALRQAIPDVVDVRVSEVDGCWVTKLKHRQKGNAGAWLPLSQESEGTLRMLGILVALMQDAPYALIGIENPETALHSSALNVLSEVIREAAQKRQIIITTQSPDLISRFTANELRVVEKVEGVTRATMMSEINRHVIEEKIFQTGDALVVQGLRHKATSEEKENVA